MALSLARQPNCGTAFTKDTAPLSSLFRFEVKALFSVFYLVVLQPCCCAATDTCPQPYILSRFYRIDIREDANAHKVISDKYLPNSIRTVVEEFCQSDFCL